MPPMPVQTALHVTATSSVFALKDDGGNVLPTNGSVGDFTMKDSSDTTAFTVHVAGKN